MGVPTTGHKYVRYICHEVLSPLQAVVLGLGYLHDELLLHRRVAERKRGDSGKGDDNSFAVIIREVRSSCSDAVEILTNLRVYSEIKGGFSRLFKECVIVRQFINDLVSSYYSKACILFL
jgi:hypothetical protein